MAIYDGPDGKPYTGHWVIPDGVSSAKFPFRQYAKSFGSYETTVHTIIPHAHPYAKTFDILKHDPKCGTSGVFYRANIENQDGVTGLKRMDIYSSSEGLKITPGEEYEFSLTYENTSGEFQDAMGSMFVDTHDKKWKRANWKIWRQSGGKFIAHPIDRHRQRRRRSYERESLTRLFLRTIQSLVFE
ncbi:MAG: hypothetical protein ACI8QF_003884 [Limisphaerales bacterium]|jgi:hypothetical protein